MKPTSNSTTHHFSGIWRSDYTYHSSDRDADATSVHYVRLYPKGGELVLESIPEVNSSYLVARFWIDDNVATGSWQEVTSAEGDYHGAIYHGAAQLIIDDSNAIAGKWVGFGKKMEVKTGPWSLTYLGEDAEVIERDKQSRL